MQQIVQTIGLRNLSKIFLTQSSVEAEIEIIAETVEGNENTLATNLLNDNAEVPVAIDLDLEDSSLRDDPNYLEQHSSDSW